MLFHWKGWCGVNDKSIKISERALAQAGEIADLYDIPQKRVLEMAIEYLAAKSKDGPLTISPVHLAKESKPRYASKDKP